MSLEYQRAFRAKAKANKVCIYCLSKLAPKSNTYCLKHLEYYRIWLKKYRAKLKASGLCLACTKPVSKTNKSFCEEHRKLYLMQMSLNRSVQIYKNKRREKFKNTDICLYCYKNKRIINLTICKYCKEKQAKWFKMRLAFKKKNGLCRSCGRQKSPNSKEFCELHFEKRRLRKAMKRIEG